MPRLSERIRLSNELKKIPISDLIAKAKLLVKAKGYPKSTIWHYNERFNDLQHFADLLHAEKLSTEFIDQYIEEGKQRSPKHARGSVQRKVLLNLVATAVDAPHVFTIEKEAEQIRTKFLRESLNAYEQHLKRQEKRMETIKSYLQVAAKFLLYLDTIKKNDPSKVTVIDIREFITDLGGKWSQRSMQIVPTLLKTYLKFAESPIEVILFSTFHTSRKSNRVHAMSSENVEALWKYIEGGCRFALKGDCDHTAGNWYETGRYHRTQA